MLESTNPLAGRGAAHWRAPDKVPSLRLRTIEEAGRLSIAFTTGILIGIGETAEDRVDSLFAIRHAHEEYGHIQEVIVQPFRAKPGTRMAAATEPSLEELQRTLAVARLVLGGDINLQSPPNLVAEEYPDLLNAGINDWGGISPVTCDFINPEAAWPQIPVLAAEIGRCRLRPARAAGDLSGIHCAAAIRGRSHPTSPAKSPGWRRVRVVKVLKTLEPRWREISWEQALNAASLPVARLLEKSLDGGVLDFEEGLALTAVEGDDLLALVKVADELRRRTVGDCITYVVNRNLNFTNICIVGCAFCGFSRGPNSPDAYFHSTETLVAKSVEAVERGATEVCIQGGLPKELQGGYYADLLRAIKTRLPELHIHAYSPMEIAYGTEKTGMALHDYLLMLKDAGLGSIPGTAAEILDDEVRRELSPNKLKVAPVDRRHPRGARLGHSLHLHDDVRPYGTSGTLGEAFASAARDSEGHGRIHRVRSVGLHPFPNHAFPDRSMPAQEARFAKT